MAWQSADRTAAFEQIMLRHERMVLRVALRMLGRLEDAQDLSQEVFLKLYKHFHQIDEERGLTSWLYRTTLNACFDHLRGRKPMDPMDWEPPVAAAQQADMEKEERRRLMAEGLKVLAERERAAVILREIEGLDTAEVAGILGTSEVTVRSQVSIAKGKLKAFVERRMR
ncbi:MAG: RNA polymerase sigma factor [Acidobacteria bacterium]|nr:RNA polymerase sigma factor [Acidobacteriota bacterium]